MKSAFKKHREFPCIESMTRVNVGLYAVRVWREEDEVKDEYDNEDIVKTVRELYYAGTQSPVGCTASAIAREVAKLPRVNAVEVLCANGRGVVVYVEWP